MNLLVTDCHAELVLSSAMGTNVRPSEAASHVPLHDPPRWVRIFQLRNITTDHPGILAAHRTRRGWT
jgi:hypothetical protein